MSNDLKISISGIRGIVGESLTPDRLLGWVLAWESTLADGPIVVARDARPHGEGLQSLVAGVLHYRGRMVLEAGLVPTPTVGVLVRHHIAAGGVMLTASHNPEQWNALKLFNAEGLILSPAHFERLEPIWNKPPDFSTYGYVKGGDIEELQDPLAPHLHKIFDEIDRDRIRLRNFKIVVDGCRSVGGIALPRVLREAGVEVIEHDCQPDGRFTRGLEPLPENLEALGEKVRESGADLGMAVDPDADRLALVDETGRAIGEEYTLVLAADAVLAGEQKGLVVNLSSTLVLDAVARKHNSPIHRSKVGEAHVVDLLLETGSAIGGEGNGGVIFPKIQLGRDAIGGAILILDLLAGKKGSLSQVIAEYPPASMVKSKITTEPGLWNKIVADSSSWWGDAEVNRVDGLKWIWPDRWIHLRASNTEPIIRILAEAPSVSDAQALITEAKGKICG